MNITCLVPYHSLVAHHSYRLGCAPFSHTFFAFFFLFPITNHLDSNQMDLSECRNPFLHIVLGSYSFKYQKDQFQCETMTHGILKNFIFLFIFNMYKK